MSASCCSARRRRGWPTRAGRCSPPSASSRPGDESAGIRLGEAIGTWSGLGGYELEGAWDAACRRIVGSGLTEVGDRPAVTLSGGERKQLVLEVLFASDAEVLLLDEPDNFLDVPAKQALEERIRATKKTVLLISHDRALLSAACDAIVTLEGDGCWVHGASYATYREAREHRQTLMGDRLQRWKDEELRLRELVRLFKERAKYSPRLGQEGRRGGEPLAALGRRRPAAAAGRRPVDPRAAARRRLRAPRRRAARRRDRRARRGRSTTRSTSASASG